MKYNETLLIGLALVAALVFSKSRGISSVFKKLTVPDFPLATAQIQEVKTYPQFFPVKQTNVQLYNIRDIQEKEKNERINYLQNEQKLIQDYISTQQPKANPVYSRGQSGAFLYPSDVKNIENQYGKITDSNIINYYENLFQSESSLGYGGSITGGSSRKFPKLTIGLTNMYNILIAKRNISKAEIYQEKQQENINILEEEYQTRFGGLSRYG
tara:strand:- start:837 stop:1475 length:639 start_codon:yes stop_codon:yes gene_type:complete